MTTRETESQSIGLLVKRKIKECIEKQLSVLDLRDIGFDTLPNEVGAMSDLRWLYLGRNFLKTIPSEIGKLSKCTSLLVEENGLVTIPLEIGKMNRLMLLSLSKNNLCELPNEIGSLIHLKELRLDQNKLTTLPKTFKKLISLQILSLSNNNFKNVPGCVQELGLLRALDLGSNQIHKIPRWVCDLSSLEELSMANNKINSISEQDRHSAIPPPRSIKPRHGLQKSNSIFKLENLTRISLDHNCLTYLPSEIGFLPSLLELELSYNNLTFLPETIGNLTSLQIFQINNNKLGILPSSIGSLISLRVLLLNNNYLFSLPPTIGKLIHLNILRLDNNELQTIPKEIGGCVSLVEINLNNNPSIILPSTIGNLKLLEKFLVSRNAIESLLFKIGSSIHLAQLYPSIQQKKYIEFELFKKEMKMKRERERERERQKYSKVNNENGYNELINNNNNFNYNNNNNNNLNHSNHNNKKNENNNNNNLDLLLNDFSLSNLLNQNNIENINYHNNNNLNFFNNQFKENNFFNNNFNKNNNGNDDNELNNLIFSVKKLLIDPIPMKKPNHSNNNNNTINIDNLEKLLSDIGIGIRNNDNENDNNIFEDYNNYSSSSSSSFSSSSSTSDSSSSEEGGDGNYNEDINCYNYGYNDEDDQYGKKYFKNNEIDPELKKLIKQIKKENLNYTKEIKQISFEKEKLEIEKHMIEEDLYSLNMQTNITIGKNHEIYEKMIEMEMMKQAAKQPHNEIENDEIKDLEKIGSGAFGTVWKSIWRWKKIAVKRIKSEYVQGKHLEEFKREVLVLSRTRHPNIVLFMGASTLPPNIFLVTEYCKEGSLYDCLKNSKFVDTMNEKLKIAKDIAYGMNYLHSTKPKMIIHRDLKPSNILIDNAGSAKVADFGLSRIKEETINLTAFRGTPSYMAPEMLRNENYNEKVDVYSYAIILWQLYTKQFPYLGMKDPIQIALHVSYKNLRPPISLIKHKQWEELIKICWDDDKSIRPSFKQILKILNKFPNYN
ncbi:hypothetical protein M0813_20988 [Anaeramoeba flamelloides]|uniref:Protein kinase domain-containing protein n=1 Tax=Anaeramoeba flamelloides TaxID=1746091 RepID=A0ABQ8YJY8_9EUKA|nr:hypothetical protein M0813_20988 [Anaeramoeba flamelloides]